MHEPAITGPALFNTNLPETFRWKSAIFGWRFTVSGSGDESFDGDYTARTWEDFQRGVYRKEGVSGSDDRWLNYVYDMGSEYWVLGYSIQQWMWDAHYYSSGSLSNGPGGTWWSNYGPSPSPTVSKTDNALTGIYQWQVVEKESEGGTEPDPGEWSEETTDTEILLPDTLAEADHVLFVREKIDSGNWTDAGEFEFTAGAFPVAPPVIDGPAAVNTTFAGFEWRTGKTLGKRWTVTGHWDTSWNGIYEAPTPEDEAAGRWKKTDRDDRWFFFNSVWSSYYGRYYNYWVFNVNPYTGTSGSPAYKEGGELEVGPSTGGYWYGDYGGAGNVQLTFSWRLGLTGEFQHALVASDDQGAPDWSTPTSDLTVMETGIAEGVYKLLVREKIDDTRWTDPGEFDFTAAFQPIAGPALSGVTPTDDFAPTLKVYSIVPGPDRLRVYNAGTERARGIYAQDGMLNGFPLFKKVGDSVFLFNGNYYDQRRWGLYGADEWTPWATDDYYWSYPIWYYNDSLGNNPVPPTASWGRSEGTDPVPAFEYGTYAAGQGTGQFQFRVDGGEWSGAFTGDHFILPTQPAGIHVVEVRELGENGLWGSVSAPLSLDISLIAAPVVTGPIESVGGWHVTFGWSVTSGSRGTRVFRYRMNGGPWSPEKAGAISGNTASTVAQLRQGINAFDVQEKSTTSGWSVIGTHEIEVSNTFAGWHDFPIPPGSRIVVMDSAGREYLWGPEARQLSPSFAPLLMSPPNGEVQYLFVTSKDKYHLLNCPYGQSGILLTVPELIARVAIPCGKCNPPALA